MHVAHSIVEDEQIGEVLRKSDNLYETHFWNGSLDDTESGNYCDCIT